MLIGLEIISLLLGIYYNLFTKVNIILPLMNKHFFTIILIKIFVVYSLIMLKLLAINFF